jgi:Secretion system C-terminal sorting domain
MKKNLLLVTLFLSSVFSLTAQNIRLIDLNGNDVTNTTIYDNVDTSSIDPYEYDLNVINNTSNNVSINCWRFVNNLVPISESYFCWDQCYSTIVDLAAPIAVNANDTITGFFHAYFNSYQQSGVSVMSYQFFNPANTNDTANITLVLNAGTLGVKSIGLSATNKLGSAFPNPSTGLTSINYLVDNGANAAITLTNELGSVVYTQQLENSKGTVRINTSALAAGIYFYALQIDNATVVSKKLIVTQ